jgi:hypothetical protein
MRKTYIYVDGKLVEKSRRYKEQVAPDIMPDIQPYQSMADGTMITSRSHHREHLRQHNCIEIGNEKMENRAPVAKDTRREVLREQVAGMTHDQANRVLAKLRDDIRFTRS